jgi:SAM-dependent methyltransferase
MSSAERAAKSAGGDGSIATMPLYTHLDRIERGLAAQGIGPKDRFRPEQLFTLDQWHYHGTDAIRYAASFLQIGPRSRVLDVGSGIGGPARFLAHTTGCHVLALELQPELHAIGLDLTRRCGLDSRVTHVCGDALTHPIMPSSFDVVLGFLSVLHVADRPALMRRFFAALKPSGRAYIEDLCQHAPFAPADFEEVRTIVHGQTVTSIADYVKDLVAAGFADVAAADLTSDWAPFAAERLAAWQADRHAYSSVHGEGAWAAQDLFYRVIDGLYREGSLGGVRLTGRRP